MKCRHCKKHTENNLKEVLEKGHASTGRTIFICKSCGKKFKTDTELFIGLIGVGLLGYFLIGLLSSFVENEFIDKYLDTIFCISLLGIVIYKWLHPREIK